MLCFVLCLCLLAIGCRSHGPGYLPSEPERVEMLSLMLPQKIRIEPFTQVKSFDQDDIPDGILAVIRPLDKFGDPVKAAGLFYFELWSYVEASQERKGERLAFWDRTLASPEEIRLYWTRAHMYEFQLAWTGGEEIQPEKKYVFTATYRTPWDETIRDEHIIEFHLPPRTMIASTAPAGAAPPKLKRETPNVRRNK